MSEAPFIPLAIPSVGEGARRYLNECIDTNFVSSVGAFVRRFESGVADYVGTSGAVATSSGTAALHLALEVAGVGPGDAVLVSDLTFIAPANAVRYLGADPVLIGPEPSTWQMDPDLVDSYLSRQCSRHGGRLVDRSSGARVAAIVPVHLLGHPADMDAINELAAHHEIPVIEDASQSIGAEYRGRRTGSLGEAACFSFNGNKIITCGGGGMLVTDDDEWATRARYLSTQAKDDPIEYRHGAVGYNYRLTNVAAAVGLAQLERLDEFVARKRAIADRYARAFRGLAGVELPPEADYATCTYWLYTILVDPEVAGTSRKGLHAALRSERIESRPFYLPVHRQEPYAGAVCLGTEHSDRLHCMGLSLPSSVGLSEEDQERVIDVVRRELAGVGA